MTRNAAQAPAEEKPVAGPLVLHLGNLVPAMGKWPGKLVGVRVGSYVDLDIVDASRFDDEADGRELALKPEVSTERSPDQPAE